MCVRARDRHRNKEQERIKETSHIINIYMSSEGEGDGSVAGEEEIIKEDKSEGGREKGEDDFRGGSRCVWLALSFHSSLSHCITRCWSTAWWICNLDFHQLSCVEVMKQGKDKKSPQSLPSFLTF